MNSFETIMEMVFRQYDIDISKHERVMKQKDLYFQQFQIDAEDFDKCMDKFSCEIEQWLIQQGKSSESPGIFF
jgi:hypothetical protein